MNSICRLCLTITEEYFSINETGGGSNISVSSVLKTIVPELCQQISNDPVICKNCHKLLYQAYNFRLECMKTENLIATFLHITRCTDRTLCLRDVIDWCKNGIFGVLENFMSSRCDSVRDENSSNNPQSSSKTSNETERNSKQKECEVNNEEEILIDSAQQAPPVTAQPVDLNETSSKNDETENSGLVADEIVQETIPADSSIANNEQISNESDSVQNCNNDSETSQCQNEETRDKNENECERHNATDEEQIISEIQKNVAENNEEPEEFLIDDETPLIFRLPNLKQVRKQSKSPAKRKNSKSALKIKKEEIRKNDEQLQEQIENKSIEDEKQQEKLNNEIEKTPTTIVKSSTNRQSRIQKVKLDGAPCETVSVLPTPQPSPTSNDHGESVRSPRPKRQRKKPTKQELDTTPPPQPTIKRIRRPNKKTTGTIDKVIEEVIEGLKNVTTTGDGGEETQPNETSNSGHDKQQQQQQQQTNELIELINFKKPIKVYVRKRPFTSGGRQNDEVCRKVMETVPTAIAEIQPTKNESPESPECNSKCIKTTRKRYIDPDLVLGITPVPCKCRKVGETTAAATVDDNNSNMEKVHLHRIASPSTKSTHLNNKTIRKIFVRKHYTIEKQHGGSSGTSNTTIPPVPTVMHPMIKVRPVSTLQAHISPSKLMQQQQQQQQQHIDTISSTVTNIDTNPKWHKITETSSAITSTVTTTANVIEDKSQFASTTTTNQSKHTTQSEDVQQQCRTSVEQDNTQTMTATSQTLETVPMVDAVPPPPPSATALSEIDDSKEPLKAIVDGNDATQTLNIDRSINYSFLDLSERIDFLEFQSPINLNEITVGEASTSCEKIGKVSRNVRKIVKISPLIDNQFDSPEYVVINKINKKKQNLENKAVPAAAKQSKQSKLKLALEKDRNNDEKTKEENTTTVQNDDTTAKDKKTTEENKRSEEKDAEAEKNQLVVKEAPPKPPEPPRQRRRKPRPIVQQVINGIFTNNGDYINDHDYFSSPYIQNKIYRRRERKCIFICFLCNFIHYEKDHFNHMSRHSTICQMCNIKFANAFILNIHVQIYHYFCKKCNGFIPFREPHRCQQQQQEQPKNVSKRSTKKALKGKEDGAGTSAQKNNLNLRRSPRLAKKSNNDKPTRRSNRGGGFEQYKDFVSTDIVEKEELKRIEDFLKANSSRKKTPDENQQAVDMKKIEEKPSSSEPGNGNEIDTDTQNSDGNDDIKMEQEKNQIENGKSELNTTEKDENEIKAENETLNKENKNDAGPQDKSLINLNLEAAERDGDAEKVVSIESSSEPDAKIEKPNELLNDNVNTTLV